MTSLLPILAQVEAPPADFTPWFANAAYLVATLGGVLWVWTLIRDLRAKKDEIPQPFTVTQHVDYVPLSVFEKEMKQAHGRMNRENADRDEELKLMRQEIAGIRQQTTDNHEAGEARATKIHDRINALVLDNATMPQRVVTLLRETKGLL